MRELIEEGVEAGERKREGSEATEEAVEEITPHRRNELSQGNHRLRY